MTPICLTALVQNLEDPVSGEVMTQAVTMVPCGHTMNEVTVIQRLAQSRLCPLDRQPIEKYIPNYTVRHMAETHNQHPAEEPPPNEAISYFQKGKYLADIGTIEPAIDALLQALRICPTYKKAQDCLEFCLNTKQKEVPQPPTSQSKDQIVEAYLRLFEHPLIQKHTTLPTLIEQQVEQLMAEGPLTTTQEDIFNWSQKLILDQKISLLALKKLEQLSGMASSGNASISTGLSTSRTTLLATASSQPIPKTTLPSNVFGAAKWAYYFGDVGVEPPLPPDINAILSAPCPFFPGKTVQETQLLTLIPKTVNGTPLTLNTLGKLVEKPKQGHAAQYSFFDESIKDKFGNIPLKASYWVLLTKDVIPGSRGHLYDKRLDKPQVSAHYEMPHLLEAATSIFMHYVQTGTRLYSDDPWIYLVCQENIDESFGRPGIDRTCVVGGFSMESYDQPSPRGGLLVRFAEGRPDRAKFHGLGASRKL